LFFFFCLNWNSCCPINKVFNRLIHLRSHTRRRHTYFLYWMPNWLCLLMHIRRMRAKLSCRSLNCCR
jgi:hypothetical protein